MPQMTSTIDYKALAERVARRAIYADNNADQNNKTWAADLRTIVSLLNGMAGQKPFAWAIRDGWSQTRFSVDPDTPILGTRRADYVVDALYPHPAPAAPQAEQPIDLDAVAMQQMRQAAAESTWMPAEYSGDDWISDVCRWLRDGPPQAEPIDPHMIVADDRFPDEQAEPKRDQPLLDLLAVIHCDGGHHTEAVGIEQSIKDAQVAVSELKNSLATGDNDATRTVEREPLSDWRIGELYRQWLAESETTTIADLMRSVERAHEIGGSDAE